MNKMNYETMEIYQFVYEQSHILTSFSQALVCYGQKIKNECILKN